MTSAVAHASPRCAEKPVGGNALNTNQCSGLGSYRREWADRPTLVTLQNMTSCQLYVNVNANIGSACSIQLLLCDWRLLTRLHENFQGRTGRAELLH